MIFGRESGPVKFALGVLGLGTILVLVVTMARLNTRLATMEQQNRLTLAGARAIATADDRFTRRLQHLSALVDSTNLALDETRKLQPLLTDLKAAVVPAAAAVSTGSGGGVRSNVQLRRVEAALLQLQEHTLPLVRSADAFGGQGEDLLHVIDGLVADLRAGVDAAARINAVLPLPRTGN
ncbi:MAG TPA: hypothetical protein VL595_25290 [Pseudonocardia sp.]|jgi:hypothetical protein|nr:hypothetical protein [Pseudonocardia sp.]